MGTIYLWGCLQPSARHTVIHAWRRTVVEDFFCWSQHLWLLRKAPAPPWSVPSSFFFFLSFFFFFFFLPIAIPRQRTRRKGVGEGKARTHPHILYPVYTARMPQTTWGEYHRLSQIGNSFYTCTGIRSPGERSWLFTSLIPASSRSIKSHPDGKKDVCTYVWN